MLRGVIWSLLIIGIYSLTCDEIKGIKGGASSMSSEMIMTLKPADVDLCLAELGKDRLSPEQGKLLWSLFTQNYDSMSEIPVEKLRVMGWISIGMGVEDIRNVTFEDMDLIQAFGFYHALTTEQLSALAEKYFEFSNKLPDDMTYYDLISLRQILCAFNKSDIVQIHPEEYKQAAGVLGTLKDCPHSVLEGLAFLALSSEAFGPITEWKQTDINLIGNVLNGLTDEQKSSLPQSRPTTN